jgi:hypothetical protein
MAIPKVSAITRFCFRMQQFQSPCWASLKLRNPWRLRDTSNSQGGQRWILNQIHQSIDGASPSCGERFTFLINQDRPWTNERAEDTSSGFREPLRAQSGAQDLAFGARVRSLIPGTPTTAQFVASNNSTSCALFKESLLNISHVALSSSFHARSIRTFCRISISLYIFNDSGSSF